MKYLYIIMLVFISCMAGTAQETLTIYQIQGQQEASPYEGQIVTTSGIVTSVFSTGYCIQDGQGEWTGIYVYGSANVNRGDLVEITGEVSEYFGLTEIKNVSSLELLSSGNPLFEPELLGTWDVNDESWEGVLVQVSEAVCTNTNLGFGEWELNDGSGPCRVDDMGIVFIPDQGIRYAVTGPVFYSFDNYKIEARDADDIQILEPIYFTSEPEQENLTKNSFTLNWETNIEATTELYYGLTPELELGLMSIAGTGINHQIAIAGLDPGQVYYVRPFSVADSDTTANYLMPYATVSNSSGAIKVLFNHKVDETLAIIEPAEWSPNIADSVISFIEMAQQSLDITMYEQESEPIVAAINDAYSRGVQVRYITDDIGNNPALDGLNDNIPVLHGNTDAIMHNKFLIIDKENEMDCWVMTGSLNHTENNLGWDYNNMICIQDQSLARAYTLEFEEMWGAQGNIYNEANARFGAEKTNNTPHRFLIDNIPVQLYFSPSDGTTSQIAAVIDQASETIEFGIMVFTENTLGNAILNAHQSGVEIRGIIDYVEYSGSEYQMLKDNGVAVRDYANPDGTSWPDGPVFHHKYMIADFNPGSANPVLITGSHNWSASAESVNDENTLIIHNFNLANLFHQEFSQRFNEQITPTAMNDDMVTQINTQLQIDCLANDFIPEDVIAELSIIVDPWHGQAAWDGVFINYLPAENYVGVDSLTYILKNTENQFLADTAYVRIAVGNVGVDEIPFAGFDFSIAQIPGSGAIDIRIKSKTACKAKLTLYDQKGSLLKQRTHRINAGEESFSMEVGNRSGIYFLQIQTTDYRKTRKFYLDN